MGEQTIGKKAVTATKWSLLTQIASKIIQPITTLVLAHILTPDLFGVIALVTMVTSFANMFSDAGFQKYLVQHEFKTDAGLHDYANVAFWTNLAISFLLWFLIGLFRDGLAALLGDITIGWAITVASSVLPLTAAISVQTALYQRALSFKVLFSSRFGSSLLTLVVAVPLAFAGFGYWSMIVATIASNALLAVWLTIESNWKPTFSYSFRYLERMFSFSAWTLLEAFTIWLAGWAGSFILGNVLDAYYLGLYRTSVSLVSAATGLISSAVTPVIFATLSRMQGDRAQFDRAYFKMQSYLAMFVVPIAFALFVFRESIVLVFLGDQWVEASTFLGLYGMESAFSVVIGYMASEAYRSLGKPRLSVAVQLAYLAATVPCMFFSAKAGFDVFSIALPLVTLFSYSGSHLIACKTRLSLSITETLKVLLPYLVICVLDSFVCNFLVVLIPFIPAHFLVIPLYCLLYLALLVSRREQRDTLIDVANRFGLTRFLPHFLLK